MCYCVDKVTGKRTSLQTADADAAARSSMPATRPYASRGLSEGCSSDLDCLGNFWHTRQCIMPYKNYQHRAGDFRATKKASATMASATTAVPPKMTFKFNPARVCMGPTPKAAIP